MPAASTQDATLRVAAAETIDEINAALGEIAAAYRFSAYAGGMVTGPIAHSNQPFFFSNWSDYWIRLYAERGYLQKDAIPRWAVISGAPVRWSALKKTLPPNDPGHEVFATATAHDYHEGLVVPVRTLSGALGLISWAGDREDLTDAEVFALHPLCTAAILRAEALTLKVRVPTLSPLTLRERECTSLLVQGLADAQIGTALGISTETVRFHLDNARKKLKARSRAQLAAIAAGTTGKA
jgi:DNA-binding CsgD family transcriptional regulator